MALPLSDDRPVFPPEIERHIFELSALARPVLVPKLIFVAWRIKQWYVKMAALTSLLDTHRIEPILYRTIVLGRARSTMDGYPAFTSEALLSAIQTKAPGFIATAVQNLSIYDSAAGYEEILSACTGVTNLRVLSLDTAFSAHIPSTLTQLYVYDFPHESSAFLFSQLTHLDVMGLNFLDIDLDAFHSSVALLPHLTHVSFSDRDYTPIFLRLLRGCPKIEVFFYCDQDDEPLLDQETLAEDPRFVVLRLRAGTMWNWDYDWLMGVHCGRDYWYRVERFIQKRRSGEVDRRRSVMSPQEWLD